MNERFPSRLVLLAAAIGFAVLSVGLAMTPSAAEAQNGKKRAGKPFLTVFPLAGLTQSWWLADYDHRAKWFQTAWRASSTSVDSTGLRLDLAPTAEKDIVPREMMKADDGTLAEAGKTTKKFTSGQVQRRGWYGYGRYEVVMQPAIGEGLVSSFYIYTGPHFGDTHEEIDIEFLGRDTNGINLNRFRDGQPLEKAEWIDLGFDAHERPRLYAFEWSENAVTWYAGNTEIFHLSGADEIPKPPAKIYMDLWAGGPRQADWSGEAPEGMTGESLILCASFTPPDRETPQCSDLMKES